jgi:hypothetical protein
MIEKTHKFYISLLPLIVIIILIVGAGYLLLADEIKLPFGKGPQIRRIDGFPAIVYTVQGQTSDKMRVEIKSEKELSDFLNTVDKSGLLTMREKIDFNKEYLVAVASSIETIDGHKLKIRKMYEDKQAKTLLISIVETYPGDTCAQETNPHIGVDIVAINKTDWTIDFERTKDVQECSSTN